MLSGLATFLRVTRRHAGEREGVAVAVPLRETALGNWLLSQPGKHAVGSLQELATKACEAPFYLAVDGSLRYCDSRPASISVLIWMLGCAKCAPKEFGWDAMSVA